MHNFFNTLIIRSIQFSLHSWVHKKNKKPLTEEMEGSIRDAPKEHPNRNNFFFLVSEHSIAVNFPPWIYDLLHHSDGLLSKLQQ
jgi:hypothetical protein